VRDSREEVAARSRHGTLGESPMISAPPTSRGGDRGGQAPEPLPFHCPLKKNRLAPFHILTKHEQ
jgi:hypothetical protein